MSENKNYKVQVGAAISIDFAGIENRQRAGMTFTEWRQVADGILPQRFREEYGEVKIGRCQRQHGIDQCFLIAYDYAEELFNEQGYDWYSGREYGSYADQLLRQLDIHL